MRLATAVVLLFLTDITTAEVKLYLHNYQASNSSIINTNYEIMEIILKS